MVDRRTRSTCSSRNRTSTCATSLLSPSFPGNGKVCDAMNETQLVAIVPTWKREKPSFCTPTWNIGSGSASTCALRSRAALVSAFAWASSVRASSASATRASSAWAKAGLEVTMIRKMPTPRRMPL